MRIPPYACASNNVKRILRYMSGAPVLIMAGALIIGCQSNEMEEVLAYSEFKEFPDRSTSGVTYLFTDSGKVKNKLEAALVEQFVSTDSSYSLISGGFTLYFYSDRGALDGTLTALNAWISGDNSHMVARDSVVFVNTKQEVLRTEELTWWQDSAKVMTDKFVTIERADAVIYGKGLISNENFTDYEIQQPSGVLYLNENEGNEP